MLITLWLSRDPIARDGGVNLYGFVVFKGWLPIYSGNMPTCNCDRRPEARTRTAIGIAPKSVWGAKMLTLDAESEEAVDEEIRYLSGIFVS
ncbi:MAG: hypothetical protein ACR2RV_13910 [Verrucomicrobiales bacterium]